MTPKVLSRVRAETFQAMSTGRTRGVIETPFQLSINTNGQVELCPQGGPRRSRYPEGVVLDTTVILLCTCIPFAYSTRSRTLHGTKIPGHYYFTSPNHEPRMRNNQIQLLAKHGRPTPTRFRIRLKRGSRSNRRP
jgi:hypothetical protein